MENLLKQIKYNRIYSSVDNIINRCDIHGQENYTLYYRIKIDITRGREHDILFYIRSNGHYLVKRDMFLKHGMCELITQDELAKYIYEKIIKPNQKE